MEDSLINSTKLVISDSIVADMNPKMNIVNPNNFSPANNSNGPKIKLIKSKDSFYSLPISWIKSVKLVEQNVFDDIYIFGLVVLIVLIPLVTGFSHNNYIVIISYGFF